MAWQVLTDDRGPWRPARAKRHSGPYQATEPIWRVSELCACSRTVGYFTPIHERGTKWDNIEEHIPTSLKQAPLIGFMSLAQRRAA